MSIGLVHLKPPSLKQKKLSQANRKKVYSSKFFEKLGYLSLVIIMCFIKKKSYTVWTPKGVKFFKSSSIVYFVLLYLSETSCRYLYCCIHVNIVITVSHLGVNSGRCKLYKCRRYWPGILITFRYYFLPPWQPYAHTSIGTQGITRYRFGLNLPYGCCRCFGKVLIRV